MSKETEQAKPEILNRIVIEFLTEGSTDLKAMYISPNVNPLQIIAIAGYMRLMAESQIMAIQEGVKNDTIKGDDKPQILRTP